MSHWIICEQCHAKLKAPDAAAGRRLKCPKCFAAIQVPVVEVADEDEEILVLDDGGFGGPGEPGFFDDGLPDFQAPEAVPTPTFSNRAAPTPGFLPGQPPVPEQPPATTSPSAPSRPGWTKTQKGVESGARRPVANGSMPRLASGIAAGFVLLLCLVSGGWYFLSAGSGSASSEDSVDTPVNTPVKSSSVATIDVADDSPNTGDSTASKAVAMSADVSLAPTTSISRFRSLRSVWFQSRS